MVEYKALLKSVREDLNAVEHLARVAAEADGDVKEAALRAIARLLLYVYDLTEEAATGDG